jgi:glucose-6-phosphate 1-dehydrogenase
MLAHHHPDTEEVDAYELLLSDAMAGDTTLFARQDYVEESWRIADPVLKMATPVYEYDPGSWGPSEITNRLLPLGGWDNPVVASSATAAVGSSFK